LGADAGPERRHPGEADAVLDDVEDLAIGQLLGERIAQIRRLRKQSVAEWRLLAAAGVAVAEGTIAGEMLKPFVRCLPGVRQRIDSGLVCRRNGNAADGASDPRFERTWRGLRSQPGSAHVREQCTAADDEHEYREAGQLDDQAYRNLLDGATLAEVPASRHTVPGAAASTVVTDRSIGLAVILAIVIASAGSIGLRSPSCGSRAASAGTRAYANRESLVGKYAVGMAGQSP